WTSPCRSCLRSRYAGDDRQGGCRRVPGDREMSPRRGWRCHGDMRGSEATPAAPPRGCSQPSSLAPAPWLSQDATASQAPRLKAKTIALVVIVSLGGECGRGGKRPNDAN